MQLDHFILSNTAAAAHLAEARDAGKNGGAPPAREAPGPEVEVQPLYLVVARECVLGEVEIDAVLVRARCDFGALVLEAMLIRAKRNS